MNDVASPDCMDCANLNREDIYGLTCKAFPDGIPDAIINGERNHREPFKGDGGIRFEKFDLKKAMAAEE